MRRPPWMKRAITPLQFLGTLVWLAYQVVRLMRSLHR